LTPDTRQPSGGESPGLAAFDFDGTLRPGDSLLPFLSAVAGRATAITAIAASAGRLVLRGHRPDRDVIKGLSLARLLAGREAARFSAFAESFGRALIDDLRPDVVARLRAHQQLGHVVVMVSASLTAYLAPVAAHLGCGLAATALVVGPDGRLTGQIDGVNCRGPEKVARLQALFPRRPGEVWAYGDSRGDDEMLEWADHRVRIGRKPIIGPL